MLETGNMNQKERKWAEKKTRGGKTIIYWLNELFYHHIMLPILQLHTVTESN